MNLEEILKNYGPVLTLGASVVAGGFLLINLSVTVRANTELKRLKQALSQAPKDRDALILLRKDLNGLKSTTESFTAHCFSEGPKEEAYMFYSCAPYLESIRTGLIPYYRVQPTDCLNAIESLLKNDIRFDASEQESEEAANDKVASLVIDIGKVLDRFDSELSAEIHRLDSLIKAGLPQVKKSLPARLKWLRGLK
jgi:hypothetical protein